MTQSNCQVCGNPMFSQSYCGTDADGSLNMDYCSNCYKGGQFYTRDGEGNIIDSAMPWAMMHSAQFVAGRGFGT